MKMKSKSLMAAGIMALMAATATGCGSGKETERENAVFAAEEGGADASGKDADGRNTDVDSDKRVPDDGNNTDADAPNGVADIPEDTTDDAPGEGKNSYDVNIIGGKVRSIAEDSFVISRTLYDDSDMSIVIMPEPGSPEEQLVTVRYTDATTFEHWTISGGGAGIERREAAPAEIAEGGGIEAEGHFEGEEFMADKIIIEVYK